MSIVSNNLQHKQISHLKVFVLLRKEVKPIFAGYCYFVQPRCSGLIVLCTQTVASLASGLRGTEEGSEKDCNVIVTDCPHQMSSHLSNGGTFVWSSHIGFALGTLVSAST